MNSAQMKSTEIQTLWKLVKAGEKRPLSAADLALLLRLRFALQEYAATMPEATPTEQPLTAMTPSVIVKGRK
jgi:hypothetical protein